MPDTQTELFDGPPSQDRVKLRTLTNLRWVAVAGQIIAIALSQRLFDLHLHVGLCAIAIGLSIVVNLIFQFVYPENKRLTNREAALMLAFDTVQLGFLLGITGGINNPFALLILAPVTVAASALSLGATLVLGLVAIVVLSMISLIHLPLVTVDGRTLSLPELFAVGYWIAIAVSIIFIGAYNRRVSSEINDMGKALLATQMALAREQKLTDLGGVVAAAAHELGTPLATIKLVASEMRAELEAGSEMHEDATLIRDQADRCRDILRSMGRAGKDDLHLRQALLGAVIEEAAEPHMNRGKTIVIQTGTGMALPDEQPMILRYPEVIHGLRNLIQNAVDFAASTVWIETCWTDTSITVRILDDGTGYPPHLLGRIGDPFIRKGPKPERDDRRPQYEGMGLGLFIAKTLLERTGADLNFANGTDPFTGVARPGERSGAIVELVWPRGPD
ncbi:MAG TPA: ActS/PrrB/RegB family redox-sensitive histidine kinase, partial [Rhodobacterales bacterium]|nr:ActS/PrrB/RegB family redox-sensitive histidine kinase [Rhodobacterales bacterium]